MLARYFAAVTDNGTNATKTVIAKPVYTLAVAIRTPVQTPVPRERRSGLDPLMIY